MPSMAPRLWAFLCLLLVLQMVSAETLPIARRQDDRPANERIGPTDNRPEPTTTLADDKKPAETSELENEPPRTTSTVSVKPTTSTRPISSSKTFTATASKTPTSDPNYFNTTIPEGQLPITPKITPGWGVAGVIMMLTGSAYTLIGIKNKWVHTFFSSAFSAALCITVLIVYVMNTPVSNGAQGGYVAGTILAGCIVGAAASFFKEITEGLGCALGGFCMSMWLLCLIPGGLLHAVASKAILISCFTAVAFGFYLARLTRDWALMVMISFAGATVLVLGIDAFSRAGLKEFWAYVWDLNSELFPLGANTYPITKGIRVETAAIIIFCLVGVVSQVKLWRVIREQKKKRAEERAQAQRDLDAEEENIGRQLEEETSRERQRWERAHGGVDMASSSISRDSGDDGMSEEKLKHTEYIPLDEIVPSAAIELDRMTLSGQAQSTTMPPLLEAPDGGRAQSHLIHSPSAAPASPDAGLIQPRSISSPLVAPDEGQVQSRAIPSLLAAPDGGGRITVRVITDDTESPYSSPVESEPKHNGVGNGLDPTEYYVSRDDIYPQAPPVTKGPDVVPLPFKVPDEDDAETLSDRSSVATFADDVVDSNITRQDSTTQRLSRHSKSLLRKLSKSSKRTTQNLAFTEGTSTEGLIPQQHHHHHDRHDDDNESIAATMDMGSVSSKDDDNQRPHVQAEKLENTADTETPREQTETSGTNTKADAADAVDNDTSNGAPRAGPAADKNATDPRPATSEASAPVNLTKDCLPRPLSRVAKSYRTNEWAKHLSHADAPPREELELIDGPAEAPAPVDLEDLQRTAVDGAPVPVPSLRNSASQVATLSEAHLNHQTLVSRRESLHQQPPPSPTQSSVDGRFLPPGGSQLRSASVPLHSPAAFAPIVEEQANGHVVMPSEDDAFLLRSSDRMSQQMPQQSPPVAGLTSYSSPQTLIGQREMFLRSKSQGNLYANMTQEYQESTYRAPSDVGSLYNYPMYAAALVTDPDDLPLSQRQNLMRQSSAMSLARSQSGQALGGVDTSEGIPFDSHQPKRNSSFGLTPAARQAQLANFRQSVAQDLRSGTPLLANTRRETPFASTTNLLSGSREVEVQRNIELQRNMIMGQKEAEAQRREMQLREKEFADRAFDERMRNGDLLDAHREVMRKMQRKARDQ